MLRPTSRTRTNTTLLLHATLASLWMCCGCRVGVEWVWCQCRVSVVLVRVLEVGHYMPPYNRISRCRAHNATQISLRVSSPSNVQRFFRSRADCRPIIIIILLRVSDSDTFMPASACLVNPKSFLRNAATDVGG